MKQVVVRDAARFASDRYQKVDLFGSPHMFFDLYCLEPGQEQQGHAHDGSDKIYFVLDGVGRVEIDGESASIEAGAAVIAPAGSQHGLKNASTDRLVVLVAMAPRPAGAK